MRCGLGQSERCCPWGEPTVARGQGNSCSGPVVRARARCDRGERKQIIDDFPLRSSHIAVTAEEARTVEHTASKDKSVGASVGFPSHWRHGRRLVRALTALLLALGSSPHWPKMRPLCDFASLTLVKLDARLR